MLKLFCFFVSSILSRLEVSVKNLLAFVVFFKMVLEVMLVAITSIRIDSDVNGDK